MTPDPAKLALRPRLRAARDSFVLGLAPGERPRLESEAARHLLPLIEGLGRVAFYQAIGSEIGCGPAIERAVAAGIDIALPAVSDDGLTMRFLGWAPGARLTTGWRGLRQPPPAEPVTPDAFIIPLLGFDSGLRRIGQGGGFYDRALAAHPHAKKIGFGWSIQQLPAVPCDPWDERLDMVVTEQGLVRKDDA